MTASTTRLACGLVALAGSSFAAGGGPEGGETPERAVPIDALPFTGFGDTSDNADDFDVTCPYAGSTSPDVFYRYTAPVEEVLRISLCESGYDTKTYVLDASTLDLIGCNDDSCSDATGNPFRSYLEVLLDPGAEVLIAVDGWNGDSGAYEIEVASAPLPPPCVDCPDGALDEGEPCADDGSVDTNGGCNSSPEPLYFDVSCGDVVCGEAWALGGVRDTDWYRLDVTDVDVLHVTLTAAFESSLFYLPCDCDVACLVDTASGGVCETISLTVEPGDQVGPVQIFVGTSGFDLVPCGGPIGNDYVLSIECPNDACPSSGDIDLDGTVGFADLVALLSSWGPCPGFGSCLVLGDLDFDGEVGFDDLLILIASYGDCPG